MPSYLSYMRQMTVMDADDDNIESWITVRGNHIPIMKGQSKEEAVKSFIEKKGKGGSSEKVDNEKIKKAITKVGSAVNERKADEKTTIKNLTKEMGLNETETQKLNEFFGTGEGKVKYPTEFETVRKNAKANPYLYDLRYTQKSKAKAYEEYKKDTEKKGPTMRISLPDGKERKEIIDRVLKDFHKNYDKLYKDDKLDAQGGDLVKKFDKDMKESSEFKEFVREVVKQRGDVFSSDREVKALMMAANEYGLVVGSNSEKKGATENQKPKNTFLSNQNTLKEFANHFGISESVAKAASEKFGDSFYNLMTKDPKAGVGIATNYKDYTKEDVEKHLQKLNKKDTEKKAPNGQTIGQLRESGKDVGKLDKAMQHINYGFYEEQGKNMTPQQLVDYLQGEIDKSYGKKDYYSSRVQTRYPEAIKLVKEYINGGSDGSVKEGSATKQSDSPLVNAVARSLNMSAENAEKEVNGAVQHIKDLIKAKDLRNGDVEETLQGLGIESDYAEEFMEWVSAPTKKKATTSKKKKEPAIVREGGVNWVDEKAWNDPRSDPWYALYE